MAEFPDPEVEGLRSADVTEILDGIEGSFEHAELGVRQAGSGDTVALEDL